MKTKRSILNALAIAATITLTSTAAMAHSDHDRSNLPLAWNFAQDTHGKVERAFNANNEKLIGLSKFEQKKFARYGIRVGHSFSSMVDGVPVQVKRTTSGIEVAKTSPVTIASNWEIPLRKINEVVLASTGANHSHMGHDHAQLPYEWEFSPATVSHIKDRISADLKGGFVGLSQFEQKMLDRYGIKVGNQFHSVVDGEKVLAERTSAGIRVHQATENI